MTTPGVPAARRQHGFHRLVVGQVVDETRDTRSFVLDVPRELDDVFAYRPGQFCTVRVRLGDDEHLRSYSMSSAPAVGDPLTLTVKRVAGGVVSNWLLDHVAPGDLLELTGPAGVFCPRDGDAPLVALCGGSGVTPVISIAKHVLADGGRHVRMLYANRDADSVIFRDVLADLQVRHPGRLEVRHHLDDAGGFLDAAAVAGFVGDTVDADFYVCGPAPFMDLAETALAGVGVPPERISIERFVDSHEIPASEPPPAPAAGDADETPAVVTIILKGTRHEVAYQPGDTLLNTARRGGLPAPFSCEAGNCATCMAMLREGSVAMRANHALDDDEVAEGWVLTCQSIPHGPTVTVEYESF